MSYQALARKYRPSNFHETIGQEHVLRALVNALDNQRLHHAYLFTGTRGVGKTSIARILAKCLNCEQGVTSKPCGVCGACQEISEGRFVDLIEVDAASRTRVEDTRELLDNVQYAPSRGRYKVYLIDEVHMLSNHSFNALLKTLEEPPPHVKFLLATTDPQKLPITVLSRCLQFSLKNMTPENIVGHLSSVLQNESIEFDNAALWPIARSADGSMRDALSLTDQAIAFGAGEVRADQVHSMLGTVDRGAVLELAEALATNNAKHVLEVASRLADMCPDYDQLLVALIQLFHRTAILQAVPDLIDPSYGDDSGLKSLAANLTAEDIQLFYQVGLKARNDLPLAPDARGGFEMALLRMLAFKPQGVIHSDYEAAESTAPIVSVKSEPVDQSVSQSSSSDMSEVAEEKKPELVAEMAASEATSVHEVEVVEVEKPGRDAAGLPPWDDSIVSEFITDEPVVPIDTAVQSVSKAKREVAESHADVVEYAAGAQPANADVTQQITEVPPVLATLNIEALNANNYAWLVLKMRQTGPLESLIRQSTLKSSADDLITIVIDEAQAPIYTTKQAIEIERLLLERIVGAKGVNIELGIPEGMTPSTLALQIKQRRDAEALATLRADPLTQFLTNELGGEVREYTVKSLKPEEF